MTGLVVTAPTDTEIVMTRVFAAPPSRVFDALTTPALLRRWHGARGWNLVECEVDLRVGGTWRFVSRGPGGQLMGHGGAYREVDRPARLVYTESFDDPWFEGESLVSTDLVEVDGAPATTRMSSTLRFASREVRDAVLRSPMERGANESYDRLAEVLRSPSQEGDVR